MSRFIKPELVLQQINSKDEMDWDVFFLMLHKWAVQSRCLNHAIMLQFDSSVTNFWTNSVGCDSKLRSG